MRAPGSSGDLAAIIEVVWASRPLQHHLAAAQGASPHKVAALDCVGVPPFQVQRDARPRNTDSIAAPGKSRDVS